MDMNIPKRGSKAIAIAGATACVIALAVSLVPTEASAFLMRGNVVANGGSNPMINASNKVFSTVGQPGIGFSAGASFQVCSGFWCFGGSRVLAVDPPGGPGTLPTLPTEFALGPPTPNPSRGDTRFSLALPQPARVTMTVFDVSGRQLGDGVSQEMDAGYHQLYWRTSNSRPGVYFAVISVDGVIKAQKRIVMVR
jgi:hypothetical protein